MTSSDSQFSLDFLPAGGTDGGWEIADSRGSLLLLYRGLKFPTIFSEKKDPESPHNHKPGFVVCDPLKRQFKEVPYHHPRDLQGHQCLGLFLLHGRGGSGGSDNNLSLSNFRVMAALLRPHTWCSGRGVPVACCVFSRRTDEKEQVWSWSALFSTWTEVKKQAPWPPSSSSLFPLGNDWHIVKKAWADHEEMDVPNTADSFYFAGRAHGSVYWGIEGTAGAAALVLDEATAAFSTFTLPETTLGSYYGRGSFRVISGDGEMRIVRLIGNNELIKVYARIDGKWAVERLVRLEGDGDCFQLGEDPEAVIVDARDTCVLLAAREEMSTWRFSAVVLQTAMEMVDRGHEHEAAGDKNDDAGTAHASELPPVRSLRWTICRLLCCITES